METKLGVCSRLDFMDLTAAECGAACRGGESEVQLRMQVHGYPHRRSVLVNGRLSDMLDLESGCPQGAIIAALLFNCGTIEGLGALLHCADLEGLHDRCRIWTVTSRILPHPALPTIWSY